MESREVARDRELRPSPIVDTHIHLFDPTRPKGVPWPTAEDGILFQPALPERYRKIVSAFDVRGAIAIEASPWPEDNEWLLEVAARDPIIVGVVGNLEPGNKDFGAQLERLHRNSLFLGIRYGNLWGRNLGAQLANRDFLSGVRLLAEMGMSLDTADPDAALIGDIVRITDKVPDLRVIIDHLPQISVSSDQRIQSEYHSHLLELGGRPQVFVKLSEILQRIDGRVPDDLEVYRDVLDEMLEIFGAGRVLFGSDWPNSDFWAPFPKVLTLVLSYFARKAPDISEKFFWQNSKIAYRWKERNTTLNFC